jgi:HD domain
VTRLPDSALSRDALELARELEPEFLFNHSLRTFLLARLIGDARALPFDEEALFVAAILHDVGLAEAYDGDERFEVEGADAARALCLDHRMDDRRAELVWDAIALHTSTGIATRKQPEVALVHLGAGADLIGSNLDGVHPARVEEVMAAHPRLGVVRAFVSALAAQIAAKPHKAPPFSLAAEVARVHLPEQQPPTLSEILATSRYPD